MIESAILPHLFKSEYRKMVSVLTRSFGLEHIAVAEDVVSETFLSALDNWPYRGIPENPSAWLYAVAKNKLRNQLTRDNVLQKIISRRQLDPACFIDESIDFSDTGISDSQLQMLFAICHPSISSEAQICLALRILCGFGLDEIATALLSNRETIHKRMQRARKKLLKKEVRMEIPDPDRIAGRLEVVVRTVYLLFSEGYYSESNNSIIRQDLCIEALNLTYLLVTNPLTSNHVTNALMSLMCFHSSRLEARQASDGGIVLYDNQDRQQWDNEFIEKGFYYLQRASKWEITSSYYLEASIAYWHTIDNAHADKWTSILKLYDLLLLTHNNPIVALNRVWAFSKVHGEAPAIEEAGKLTMDENHFYYILLAELYKTKDLGKTRYYLTQALLYCKTLTERKQINDKIVEIDRMRND